MEIEIEIVGEVARGDKHYLRKSADRKAQTSKGPSQKFAEAQWNEQNYVVSLETPSFPPKRTRVRTSGFNSLREQCVYKTPFEA